MPRPREMSRLGEKEVDPEDAQLLQEAESMASLFPEEQPLIERAEAHLEEYGKLTVSDRKRLTKLVRSE